jgi:hypothetical protein
MRCFNRVNVVDLKATPVTEPWLLKPYPYPEGLTKFQIQALWRDPGFDHHFLTGFEGQTESVFVSTEVKNRPVKMHCLFVDYDARLSDETLAYIKKYQPCDYLPTWVVTTVSGHARLIWDFEEPVRFSNDAQCKAFLQQLARRLTLSRWLPGLDLKCLKSPYQCYELGTKWEQLSESKLSSLLLQTWLLDASKGMSLLSPEDQKVEIPLEYVSAEIEKRFPGRWKGEFEMGKRGIRFWDPIADNETAAVVCPDGMLCFTGPSPFMTWRAIFGQGFVEQFEAAKSAEIMKRSLWDEHHFWIHLDDDNWERFDVTGFGRWLKCQGLSSKPATPGDASEIEQVMNQIQIHNRIRGALPFIFYPHGPLTHRGERILNTSRVKVMQPMPPGIFHDFESAIKTFPFVWSFLSQFLDLVDGKPIQLTYLLNWMKHFYETGFYQKPSPGHALVLAGRMSKGKTFLTSVLLGKLMGGSDDGSEYMVKGSQWTNQLAKWPIAFIDDDQGAITVEGHAQFSALVKKLVANQCLSYNGKWESTGQVSWNGRVIIACNDDPESLRLLPSLDASISDKISLLRINPGSDFIFPAKREETQKILDEELPYFCRFLLDMPYTESWRNTKDTRYHLKPFYHADLLAYASRGSSSYAIFELIANFLESHAAEGKDITEWRGTSTQLFQNLAASNPSSMGRLNPRSLGIALGQMRGRGIDVKPVGMSRRGIQEWILPIGLAWRDEFFSKEAGKVADFLGERSNNSNNTTTENKTDGSNNGDHEGHTLEPVYLPNRKRTVKEYMRADQDDESDAPGFDDETATGDTSTDTVVGESDSEGAEDSDPAGG